MPVWIQIMKEPCNSIVFACNKDVKCHQRCEQVKKGLLRNDCQISELILVMYIN